MSGESEAADTTPAGLLGSLASFNLSQNAAVPTPSGLEGGTVAAPVIRSNGKKKRLWLCDTGCPFDLISRRTMTPTIRTQIVPAAESQQTDTANGLVTADDVLP